MEIWVRVKTEEQLQAVLESQVHPKHLILDAALKMFKKIQKKPITIAIMLCTFSVMLLCDLFSVRISSIILMLAAGFISLLIFMAGKPAAKGGAGK